jgi:Tfp pilus assembly protein PilO
VTIALWNRPGRRRSKKRAILWIACAAVAALNLATFAFFTWGRLTESRRAESRAADVRRRLAEAEKALAFVNAQRATLDANANDMRTFETEFLKPLEEDLLAVQREVDAMVRSSGLRSRNTSYAVEKVRGVDFARCAIEMPIEGSYRNLVDLIGRIESAERFLTIESLNLARDDAGARMQLRVFAYFSGEGLETRR